MTNHELFIETLQETVNLSDIEEAVKLLRDESNTIESKLSKVIMANVLEDFLDRIETDKKCPRCGKNLYLSDLPGYDYLCTDCQENYSRCELD